MKIYNTLSGKKEELVKPKNRSLKLFVCGPTAYDDTHIGHARTQIAFDIIVKYLRSEGWRVTYLQNITDIDDKIINRARKEKTHPLKLAKQFEKRYYEDLKNLGVTAITKFARASDYIPQIVQQVQTLIRKGYAYRIENEGYYFNIKKCKDYGKLARRTVIQAEDGISRIDENVHKKNKGDFALWKFVYREGEPAWNTSLGWGRPGWHIEDTAITEKHFGPQYDLHGGGLDLKFPHHEAEIAQQEAASGKKPFVKIWLHAGLMRVRGEKMSKSLGNFITARDFLKTQGQETLRWITLQHHYRSPSNYTGSLVNQARESIESVKELFQKLALRKKSKKTIPREEKSDIRKEIRKAKQGFQNTMQDDFNTPEALAAIFELARETNTDVWSLTKKEAKEVEDFLAKTLAILGLTLKPPSIPKNIENMAQRRELSRAHKQFIQADALRKNIEALGYIVEDTPLGPLVRKT